MIGELILEARAAERIRLRHERAVLVTMRHDHHAPAERADQLDAEIREIDSKLEALRD